MKNQNILRAGKFLILFIVFSVCFFSQIQVGISQTPTPKPKVAPKPKPTPKCEDCPDNLPVADPVTPALPVITKKGTTAPMPPASRNSNEGRRVANEQDIPYEKSIEVDSEVIVNLKVCEGNVKINGWDRDELRVFVSGGSKVGFRPAAPKKKDELTNSVTILGYDPKEDKGPNLSECLYGDKIELDVPIGAKISKLTSRDSDITVKSVAKVSIEINSGNISLSEIEQEINARTFEGDISVENSSGAITLETYDGDISAYNTEPVETGDMLKVTANNSIFLQAINHSIVEAKSTSGSISYRGEVQSDGQYTFINTSGQILLAIPEDSSCMFDVNAPKGKFIYNDLPVNILTENITSTIVRVTAQMGEGEAVINLRSSLGLIRIRKIN